MDFSEYKNLWVLRRLSSPPLLMALTRSSLWRIPHMRSIPLMLIPMP